MTRTGLLDSSISAYRQGMVGYVPQASDTSEAIDRLVFDGLRAMSPAERLRLAAKASLAVERLSIAGLRTRFPDADEEELRRRAGVLRLGPALTRQAFGPAADAWIE